MNEGDRLGKFRLDRLLGEGGMGEVWAARDLDLGRSCALKVLAPRLANNHAARLRLGREARALARIKHPNVVAVYETAVIASPGSAGARSDAEGHRAATNDDRDVIAMELIEGTRFDRWIADRRAPDEILAALLGVARGLAAAHEAGVVHRDVKPHNILVDPRGHAVLTDFGIAAAPDGLSHPATAAPGDTVRATPAANQTVAELDKRSLAAPLTAAGIAVGTPSYMAPEQSAGEPVDARADQFAFCLVVWEALTGVRPPPFDDGALPRRLRAPLRRGLDPDPARRFPAMDALIAELEPRPRLRARGVALGAIAAATGALVAVAATRGSRDPVETPPPLVERRPAPKLDTTEHDMFDGDMPAAQTVSTGVTIRAEEVAELDAEIARYAADNPHAAQRVKTSFRGNPELTLDDILSDMLSERTRYAAAVILRRAAVNGESSNGVLARLFEVLTGHHINGSLDRTAAAQTYRTWWVPEHDRFALDPCRMRPDGLVLVAETLSDLYTDVACRKVNCDNGELGWTDSIPETAVCPGMVPPLLALADTSGWRNGAFGLLAILYRRHQAPELDAILADAAAPPSRQLTAVIARWRAGQPLDAKRLVDLLLFAGPDRVDRRMLTRLLLHADPAVIEMLASRYLSLAPSARGDALEVLAGFGTPAMTRMKAVLLGAPRGAQVGELTGFFARVRGGEPTDALAQYVDKLAAARAPVTDWGTALADFQRVRDRPVTSPSTVDELVAAARAELDDYHLRH